MSKTTKRDLEWALRTIANLAKTGPWPVGMDLAAAMADTARQALSGSLAGVARACADHTDNIGHPDWKPSSTGAA